MLDVNQEGKKWCICGLSCELKEDNFRQKKNTKVKNSLDWTFTPLMFSILNVSHYPVSTHMDTPVTTCNRVRVT